MLYLDVLGCPNVAWKPVHCQETLEPPESGWNSWWKLREEKRKSQESLRREDLQDLLEAVDWNQETDQKKAVYHRKHAKDMGLGHCMENCMENCWMMMGNSRLGLKCYRFLNVSQHPRQRYAQFFRLPNIQQAAGLLGALAYGQWRGEPSPRFSETAWFLWAKRAVKRNSNNLGMDQYLLIPFLVGWTSIYQLFWCSPGVQGFDPLPLKCVVFFFMALCQRWLKVPTFHTLLFLRCVVISGRPWAKRSAAAGKCRKSIWRLWRSTGSGVFAGEAGSKIPTSVWMQRSGIHQTGDFAWFLVIFDNTLWIASRLGGQ